MSTRRPDRIDPRKRVNERLNRARLTLEARRSVRPLLVIAAGLAIAIAGFVYIADHIGAGSGAKQTVRFAANDTTGLIPHRAEVRFKGIPAGIVTGVAVKDGRAVITASVLKKWGPIYRDASAQMRPNTPLQDMYLDITDRGTRAAGLLRGAVVPASHTDTSVNISGVLDAFAPNVRARMTQLFSELGKGLTDHGAQLRESFVALGPFIDVVAKLSNQLAVRSDRTRRMIHNVGQLTQVLSERDDTLRGLVRDGSSVLSATADQRVGLNGLLRELPPTLQELDTSFQTVREVLPDVDTAVRRLNPVATELPSGLSSLRAVSADARPAVRALQTPLGKLVPLAKDLRPFSKSLSGTVDAVLPQLPDVNKAFADVAGCHLAAYMFFQWTASITKFDDAMGAYPVGDFGFGLDSISGLKDPARVAAPSCAPGHPLGATP